MQIHNQKYYLFPKDPIPKPERRDIKQSTIDFFIDLCTNYDDREIKTSTLAKNHLEFCFVIKSNHLSYHIIINTYSKEHLLFDCRAKIQSKLSITVPTANNYAAFLNCEGVERIRNWLFTDLPSLGKPVPLSLDFRGHQIEIINHASTKPIDDTFWTDWKSPWKTEGAHKIYFEEIYPVVLDYLRMIMPPQSTLLDICGGNADLPYLMFGSRDLAGKVKKYDLLDRNEESLRQAGNKLDAEIAKGIATVKNCDLATTKIHEIYPDSSYDIIFGIGALTEFVLSKDVAIDVFKQSVSLLNVGGYLILSGVTHSHITSQMIEAEGLVIKNRYLPGSLIHFYVAQRLI